VLDEDAGLLERAGVEEELDPLAGREAAVGMQLGDPLRAAPLKDGLAAAAELFDGGTSGQWLRSIVGRDLDFGDPVSYPNEG
jgi:hypothetical protein